MLNNRDMIQDIKKAIQNTNSNLTKLEQVQQDRLIENMTTVVSSYSHLLSMYLASYQDDKKMSDKEYKDIIECELDECVDQLYDYDLKIYDIDDIYVDTYVDDNRREFREFMLIHLKEDDKYNDEAYIAKHAKIYSKDMYTNALTKDYIDNDNFVSSFVDRSKEHALELEITSNRELEIELDKIIEDYVTNFDDLEDKHASTLLTTNKQRVHNKLFDLVRA